MIKNVSFSLIMPCYNRAFCIEKAVNSVLNQTTQNFELVIVDDASEDGTAELIKEKYANELANGKIVFYALDKHAGVCKARNKGLGLSKNAWIGYVDSDNEIVPDFLEIFTEVIKQNRAKIFYAGVRQNHSGKTFCKPFDYKKLLRGNYIDMGTFVHARSVYKKLGGFDEELTRVVDWDIILKYTRRYRPVFIPKIVLKYEDSDNYPRITTNEDAASNELRIFQKYLPPPAIVKRPVLGFIRYSCRSDFAKGKNPFEAEYFEYRYKIFKKITLQSLEAQTDKNFNVVLLHSENMPENYKAKFRVLEYKYPFLHNLYLDDNKSLASALKDCEKKFIDFDKKTVCTFRLDNDDALPKHFIATLRQHTVKKFAGTAISLANIILLQRCGEDRYLTFKQCYPSNSIGLAYISPADGFDSIMTLGHHGRICTKAPLLCLPGQGGIQTINGENVANHFTKPEEAEKVSESELKDRLATNFPNFDFRCLKIFPTAIKTRGCRIC